MNTKLETRIEKCVGCFGASNNDCRICPYLRKQLDQKGKEQTDKCIRLR